ncbi:MAG: hypothetical protein NTU73_00710 [Ignavibacteriae bacterium]|nr:hypothetical protein [Ignavibacteriota bacterium]
MKKLTPLIFICLFIFLVSCKNNSDPVTNTSNPPVTGWYLDYHDYNIGTLFCTWPNPCLIDIVTDTIDLTKSDSMRIFMSYHSIRNNSLTVLKFPVYLELFSCTFPDSSYGKMDKIFASFNSKIILDFGFEIGTRFTIDTLQIFKKIKANI